MAGLLPHTLASPPITFHLAQFLPAIAAILLSCLRTFASAEPSPPRTYLFLWSHHSDLWSSIIPCHSPSLTCHLFAILPLIHWLSPLADCKFHKAGSFAVLWATDCPVFNTQPATYMWSINTCWTEEWIHVHIVYHLENKEYTKENKIISRILLHSYKHIYK